MPVKGQTQNVGYTKEQIDKIGNTIIYLAQHMGDLTKTKILKILFLLEEASIKKSGRPFIGIDFQLWKLGPVPKDLLLRRSALKYGVLEMLENELVNSTEFEVDFSLLFPQPSYLSERFEEAKENLEFVKHLKG